MSIEVCVPYKTEDLNPNVSSMITTINDLKTLTKHISCECKGKFDGRIFNSNQWWDNDKCQCKMSISMSVKNMIYKKKIVFEILLHVVLKTVNI